MSKNILYDIYHRITLCTIRAVGAIEHVLLYRISGGLNGHYPRAPYAMHLLTHRSTHSGHYSHGDTHAEYYIEVII